jgi:hypothetical protein
VENLSGEIKWTKILRKIGIPSACIYDLDVIKVQGNQWQERLKALNVPDSDIEHLKQEHQFLLAELQKIKYGQPDPFTKRGLPSLDQTSCERGYKFLAEPVKFGIFVIDIRESSIVKIIRCWNRR